MEYVWLQPRRQQYNRMHVKVAILVLVEGRDLNTSGAVAVVPRRVGSVLYPKNNVYVLNICRSRLISVNQLHISLIVHIAS